MKTTPDTHSKKYTAYLKLISAITVWGGSFIATKIAVQEVSPVTVVWLRFAIGIIILSVFAWRQKSLAFPGRKESLELVWLGFLGITLHQWLQSSGLVTSDAATTGWLVSTAPIFMAFFGWLLLKEKLTRQILWGILAATIGVLLVVTNGDLRSMFSGTFGKPGDFLIILSAPNWALFSVLSRPILKRLPALKVTFYTLLFGWLLTSIQFFFGTYWTEIGQLTMAGWASILFLGIFCSALAYIFYNDGLQALSASRVGVFLYLEPVIATLLAAAILSEEVYLASLAGGALILFGVWLVNRSPAPGID